MKRKLLFILLLSIPISLAACKKEPVSQQIIVPIELLAPTTESLPHETNPTEPPVTESPTEVATESSNPDEFISTGPLAEITGTENKKIHVTINEQKVYPHFPQSANNTAKVKEWNNILKNDWQTHIPDAALVYMHGVRWGRLQKMEDGSEYVAILYDSTEFIEGVPEDAVIETATFKTPDEKIYLITVFWQPDGTVLKTSVSKADEAFIAENLSIRPLDKLCDLTHSVTRVLESDTHDYVEAYYINNEYIAETKMDMPLKDIGPEYLNKITLIVNNKTQLVDVLHFAKYNETLMTYEEIYAYDFREKIDFAIPAEEDIDSETVDSSMQFVGMQLSSQESRNYARNKYLSQLQKEADKTLAEKDIYPDGIYKYDLWLQKTGEFSALTLNLSNKERMFTYKRYTEELPQYLSNYNQSVNLELQFEGAQIKKWGVVDKYTGTKYGALTENEMKEKFPPNVQRTERDGWYVYLNDNPQDGVYALKYQSKPEWLYLYRVDMDYHYKDSDDIQIICVKKGDNALLDSFIPYANSIFLQLDFSGTEIVSHNIIRASSKENLGPMTAQELESYYHG